MVSQSTGSRPDSGSGRGARGAKGRASSRRWSRRREARPGEIVAAALECFAERGFAATRLDEVASRAGVTKGTLYLYFPNKEELFKAVVRESLGPMINQAAALLERPGQALDPASRLREAIGLIARTLFGSRLAMIPKLVIAESSNFPELARFYLDEVVNRARRFFTLVLREGIEQGQFRPVDPEHLMLGFIGPVLLGVLWQNSLGPYDKHPFDLEASLRVHVDNFLRGLAASPSEEPVPPWDGGQ